MFITNAVTPPRPFVPVGGLVRVIEQAASSMGFDLFDHHGQRLPW